MADLTGSDDYNLQEAWDTVCRSFAKTTNVDLTATPRYTIDQVLDQIRQKQDDDEQRNVKYKVAKDVISKTLNCIEVLGGIAAQGASMVRISFTEIGLSDNSRCSAQALYVSMPCRILSKRGQNSREFSAVLPSCLNASQTFWNDARSISACRLRLWIFPYDG